jgi:predicted transglutaminase-like cysteine proteinase
MLRFAQNDDIKQATASAEADPYGMTNKRGNSNGKGDRRSFDCAIRKRRELLRSGWHF